MSLYDKRKPSLLVKHQKQAEELEKAEAKKKAPKKVVLSTKKEKKNGSNKK